MSETTIFIGKNVSGIDNTLKILSFKDLSYAREHVKTILKTLDALNYDVGDFTNPINTNDIRATKEVDGEIIEEYYVKIE
ncbi:hypothetical protein MY04_2570 [Flammeovirga sp. MY04]|uniref:hypothetical protein n=1 Tax=Flammeovirga sp. MY04 TaxID=1191459 RepID=UPI0008063D0D|nr:hypothetical protein [Flammeovirga sp. MY04]ANQ49939.1 hypothetical protein MY04_2570 [Flammeovirga sp. MY04]